MRVSKLKIAEAGCEFRLRLASYWCSGEEQSHDGKAYGDGISHICELFGLGEVENCSNDFLVEGRVRNNPQISSERARDIRGRQCNIGWVI